MHYACFLIYLLFSMSAWLNCLQTIMRYLFFPITFYLTYNSFSCRYNLSFSCLSFSVTMHSLWPVSNFLTNQLTLHSVAGWQHCKAHRTRQYRTIIQKNWTGVNFFIDQNHNWTLDTALHPDWLTTLQSAPDPTILDNYLDKLDQCQFSDKSQLN